MPAMDRSPGTDHPGRGRRRAKPTPQRQAWIAGGVAASLIAASAVVGFGTSALTAEDRTSWQSAKPGVERKSAAAPSATPSPTPPAGPSVTFAAVGDIIMGSTPKLPPNEGRTFFDGVKGQLTGDVVMGNFEGALTDLPTSPKCKPKPVTPTATPTPGAPGAPGPPTPPATASPTPTPPSRCFAFRMPPSYAQRIRDAGFTVVNLANNHTRDYGQQGLRETRTALEASGVQHTGAPGQVTPLQVGGIKIAVLGFAPYGWTQSVVDIPAAAALVRQATASADLVVVNMHAGAEGASKTHVKPGTEMFLGENRGDPMAFARAVIDAGADLVVGHSPHVMRGLEWYKGRLIAYSMGNFAGYKVLSSIGALGIGGILKVTLLADGTWAGGSLVPTQMVNGGFPAVDPQRRALTLVQGSVDGRLRTHRRRPHARRRVPPPAVELTPPIHLRAGLAVAGAPGPAPALWATFSRL